jgi:hypothetical protein
MIQRMQSLYLLIGLVIWSLLFLIPVVIETVPMAICFGLVGFLILISIFLYGKRELQSKLTIVTLAIQILFYALVAIYGVKGNNGSQSNADLQLWMAIPLVSAICVYLAYRGIKHDISLLKAQDRIR